MVKPLHSLTTKLIISFVVLVVVISSMTFLYTYDESKKALKSTMSDDLVSLSGAMSSQIDGDVLALIGPGMEGSPEYEAIYAQLESMHEACPAIQWVYILHVNGTAIEFWVEDDETVIGEVYDTPEAERIIAAQDNAAVSDDFYTNEWGTFLTGYAPIRDSNGTTVGVLGIDMTAQEVLARQDFIGSTIFILTGVGVLVAAIIVAVFSLTIIRDVKKLNEAATKISTGDMTAQVDMSRKDEIGELGDSFSRMLASLKFMMMVQQEEEQAKAEPSEEK